MTDKEKLKFVTGFVPKLIEQSQREIDKQFDHDDRLGAMELFTKFQLLLEIAINMNVAVLSRMKELLTDLEKVGGSNANLKMMDDIKKQFIKSIKEV